jgi:hypothetical protein
MQVRRGEDGGDYNMDGVWTKKFGNIARRQGGAENAVERRGG